MKYGIRARTRPGGGPTKTTLNLQVHTIWRYSRGSTQSKFNEKTSPWEHCLHDHHPGMRARARSKVDATSITESVSRRGLGRGDTCHLTDFDETRHVWRVHYKSSIAKAVLFLNVSGEVRLPPWFWSKIWVKYSSKLDKRHVHKMKRINSLFQHSNCASFDSSKRWFQVRRTISCGPVLGIGCLYDQASKNGSFLTSIICRLQTASDLVAACQMRTIFILQDTLKALLGPSILPAQVRFKERH